MLKKIIMTFCAISIVGCAGSPVRRAIDEHKRRNMPNVNAPEGYEFISSSSSGHKFYVAPASKAEIKIEGRNQVTGKVEVNPFTSISLFISSPYGGQFEYKVEAFACTLLPGTFAKQRPDNRGWDNLYTTEAYGTIRWQIWNYVCKK
jgi:hypothetical protein